MEQTGDLKHEALSIYQLSGESTNRRRYESPDGAGVAKLLGSLGLGEFLNTSSTGFFDAPYGYMYHQPGASRRFLSSLGSTCSRVVCQTEKKKKKSVFRRCNVHGWSPNQPLLLVRWGDPCTYTGHFMRSCPTGWNSTSWNRR